MTTTEMDSEQERKQIIMAAVDLFAEDGLGVVSMQEVVKASGLPSDTVLAHFAGKADILKALGDMNKATAIAAFGDILRASPPPGLSDIMGDVAASFTALVEAGDPVRITPQGWGVALHDKDVNAIMQEVVVDLRNTWVMLSGRMIESGQLPKEADPQDVGRTLFALFLGFIVQSLLGDVTGEHLRRALKALLR